MQMISGGVLSTARLNNGCITEPLIAIHSPRSPRAILWTMVHVVQNEWATAVCPRLYLIQLDPSIACGVGFEQEG